MGASPSPQVPGLGDDRARDLALGRTTLRSESVHMRDLLASAASSITPSCAEGASTTMWMTIPSMSPGWGGSRT